MRHPLVLPLLVLAGLSLTPPLRAEENAGRPPNIVFLLADDQRADLLGCAGHPVLRTPHVDRLAGQGVRFANAFVTTSICAASRATLLTGLVERTHRYTFGTPPIAGRFCAQSYPAVLREHGYRTGFVGKFGVKVPEGWTDRMFDVFHPLFRNPYFKEAEDGSTRHLTQITADRAIAFLRSGSPDRPFCLSVSFNAPHAEDSDKEDHYPWPRAVDGLYEEVEVPPPALSEAEAFESQPAFLKESLNRKRWFWRWDTPAKYDRNVRAYFRMLSGVDHAVGRVVAELDRLGLEENTVLIYSGDNGYYLGSRGFAGKWSHYEESLRVPLVVFDPRVPEAKRGRVVEPLVLNLDVAPTILALAGIERPERYQGRSLVPFVAGEPVPPWRTDFFCEHLFDHGAIPKWEGVRHERWVYARYFEQSPPYEFLHDLREDPQQLENLATDPGHAGVLRALRERCDELRDRYGGPWSREEFLGPSARRNGEGPETSEASTPYVPTSGYAVREVRGWTVHVERSLLQGEAAGLGEEALDALDAQLLQVVRAVPGAAVARLRDVPVWLSRDDRRLGNAQYHPNRQWLVEHGHNPDKTRAVDLPRAEGFLRSLERQPSMVLHELSHAYHDRVLGFDAPRIRRAWKRASERGLYDEVLRHDAAEARHYALTDHKEFFAELSESFFGTNDFYPFVRAELRRHDPKTHDLIAEVWGVAEADDEGPAGGKAAETQEASGR